MKICQARILLALGGYLLATNTVSAQAHGLAASVRQSPLVNGRWQLRLPNTLVAPGATSNLPLTAFEVQTSPSSRYRIIQLNFSANALNNSGQVVGNTGRSDAPGDPVMYSAGHITKLPLIRGGRYAYAFDLNDAGQVVGEADRPCCGEDAVMWVGQRILDLTGGYCDSYLGAYGVNNKGIAVGFDYLGNPPMQFDAVSFIKGKVNTLLGTFVDVTFAAAVNDAGQIVGAMSIDTYGGRVPFIVPNARNCCGPYKYGEASDINASGHVVGYSYKDYQHVNIAYLYANARNFALPGLYGFNAVANSLNRNDDIVGDANDLAGIQHAVLWHRGSITDLNSQLPKNFANSDFSGVDINDRGEILVAQGFPYRSGISFLLIPR